MFIFVLIYILDFVGLKKYKVKLMITVKVGILKENQNWLDFSKCNFFAPLF